MHAKSGINAADPEWVDLGPLVRLHDKPLSTIWKAPAKGTLLKVYRQLEPHARRDREVEALALAGRWGLPVPSVRGTGGMNSPWVRLDLVPGTSCAISTADEVERYIRLATALMSTLRSRSLDLRPGSGWELSSQNSASHLAHLLGQLSPRCRRESWWPALSDALSTLNEEQTVYLHGDIKPDHFLVGKHGIHVVDWEAAARGPAACDAIHTVFHLVRDLVYAPTPPGTLPVEQISNIAVSAGIAAWRIVLWLDRRRPQDLSELPCGSLDRLLASSTTVDVVNEIARLIAELRDLGVPR